MNNIIKSSMLLGNWTVSEKGDEGTGHGYDEYKADGTKESHITFSLGSEQKNFTIISTWRVTQNNRLFEEITNMPSELSKITGLKPGHRLNSVIEAIDGTSMTLRNDDFKKTTQYQRALVN